MNTHKRNAETARADLEEVSKHRREEKNRYEDEAQLQSSIVKRYEMELNAAREQVARLEVQAISLETKLSALYAQGSSASTSSSSSSSSCQSKTDHTVTAAAAAVASALSSQSEQMHVQTQLMSLLDRTREGEREHAQSVMQLQLALSQRDVE